MPREEWSVGEHRDRAGAAGGISADDVLHNRLLADPTCRRRLAFELRNAPDALRGPKCLAEAARLAVTLGAQLRQLPEGPRDLPQLHVRPRAREDVVQDHDCGVGRGAILRNVSSTPSAAPPDNTSAARPVAAFRFG